jgi:hypothetical protein
MRDQMMKISGYKTDKDFYAAFPDEASFMKKHGKAYAKAAQGARLKRITYGDKYDEIDAATTGSTAAQRYAASMPAAAAQGEGGKKGMGLGEMMGTAKQAYGLYNSFSGSGGAAAGSAASSIGSSAGSAASSGASSGMLSGIMGMFKENGGPIKKVNRKGRIKKAIDGTTMGPQNDPGPSNAPDWYQHNNPYFATEPGPTNNPIASQQQSGPATIAQMPTGPQPVSSVDKAPTGAGAANAPGNGYQQLAPVENKLKGWGKTVGKIDFLGIGGKVITGIGALKAEKEEKRRAKQARDLSRLTLTAARSKDIDADRHDYESRTNQRELQLPVNTGEEFFPVYGNGKEAVVRNGGKLKKAQGYKEAFAGGSFANYTGNAKGGGGAGGQSVAGSATSGVWGMVGTAGGNIAAQATGNNAGGQLGGTVGEAVGRYWGPIGAAVGKVAGTAIGGLVDTNPKKTKKYNREAGRYMAEETAIGMGAGIQNQYTSNVRNGGKLKEYREGGTIENESLGGKLKTLWGGEIETISQNPYLPNSGETGMLKGATHEEGGIGVAYSDDGSTDKVSAEAETREPIYEVTNGDGEAEAVVAGNLKISKANAEMLGDKKAGNMKVKNYVNMLSKKEAISTKDYETNSKEAEEFTPITSFDKAKDNALRLNMMGADMRLKGLAHKKTMVANLQNSINETAEEYGLSAPDLAEGKYKKASKEQRARFGKNLSKLEDGGPIKSQYEQEMEYYETEPLPVKAPSKSVEATKKNLHAPEDWNTVQPSNAQYNRELEHLEDGPVTNPTVTRYDSTVPDAAKKDGGLFSKDNIDKAMTAYNQILPYTRKSDKEALDQNQLMGEHFALSNNKVEPVYAKGYNPQLDVPYDITLQEMRNETRATTRSAQRMAGYNPAVAANIAAQEYGAMQKIGAEEFRMNQGRRDQVATANRAATNTAQLKNMEIYDQQYVRQSQAKSNTKAITQAALSSISEKFAKNKLENRKLQTYENMYNYRYDKEYRAQNENGLQTFNTKGNSPGESAKSEAEEMADMEDKMFEYKAKQRAERKAKVSRDGAMLKHLKRI